VYTITWLSATLQHNCFWQSGKIFIILVFVKIRVEKQFFSCSFSKIGNNNNKIIFMAERVRDVLMNLFSNLNILLKSMKNFFSSHSLELQCFPSTIRTKFIIGCVEWEEDIFAAEGLIIIISNFFFRNVPSTSYLSTL
jgi:hypothetical protein